MWGTNSATKGLNLSTSNYESYPYLQYPVYFISSVCHFTRWRISLWSRAGPTVFPQNGLLQSIALGLIGLFVLNCTSTHINIVSSLDSGLEKFSHYHSRYSFAALVGQLTAYTINLTHVFLSYYHGLLSQYRFNSRILLTPSQEFSGSCFLLMGEQSNTYRILLPYDRKSQDS